MNEKTTYYPVLPLKNTVIFPNILTPLFVGREQSIASVKHAEKKYNNIVLLTQKKSETGKIETNDLYNIGTIAEIVQINDLPDGTMKVLVNGIQRVSVKNIILENGIIEASVDFVSSYDDSNESTESLKRNIIENFSYYIEINKKVSPEVISSISQIDDISQFIDRIASYLDISIQKKQKILSTFDITDRLDLVLGYISEEISVIDTNHIIRNRVKQQMEKTQKEYHLNEQLKAIQRELGIIGSHNSDKTEIEEIEKKINSIKLSNEAKEKVLSELKKLSMMSPMSAEATVIRGYIDWIISIPWNNNTTKKNSLKIAKEILDAHHYGMQDVKERILEYLSVQQRVKKQKCSVICLVGPPGVGKTSLAQSISMATGRKFTKMSLGGVRDEAEVRGHRKTYTGSLPGKIIQCMKKAGTSNPVFLLDEIDKMSFDFRGDPASALLEVLDFEHNYAFIDNYLEIEYDISNVMFIATANTLSGIPMPLLDRMEIIKIPSYMENEKIHIASDYLIPKQKELNGLKEKEISFTNNAIQKIISCYTKEAGVRNLEREIAKISRKSIKKILSEQINKITITEDNLQEFCGIPKYTYNITRENDVVGVVNGLAYTEFGGDLLAIEAAMINGKGEIKGTGKLGDTMRESIDAAFSYSLSYLASIGKEKVFASDRNIHIHVPEGAIPKDGPSAGIAICSCIISLLLNIPIRASVAMTGEITLSGRVLAIGGLKEKLLGAIRGNIKTVLIPKENQVSLSEISSEITEKLNIILVDQMTDVIEFLFGEKIDNKEIIVDSKNTISEYAMA